MSDPFLAAASAEGVPAACASARDGIDAVLRDRGLRRSTPEQTALSLRRGAETSAELEGADPGPVLGMSTQLLGLLPVWNRAPLQALARIHALVSVQSPGTPVNPDGARRLTELARALAQPTAAPGVAVAALVHAEVADAAAFATHNGVVARAAERLVLVAKGVDPASLTVPEAGHGAVPDAYRAALGAYATASRGGNATGRVHWLLYAADAFGRGASASPLAAG